MTDFDKIVDAWQRHLMAGLPADCRSREASGIGLAELDADATACISVFLKNYRDMEGVEPGTVGKLKKCHWNIGTVLRELKGEAKEYFQHLYIMTGMVLEEIGIVPGEFEM